MQQKTFDGKSPSNESDAAKKQIDVNRRLNDLLNLRDNEIIKLTQRIMEL